MVWSSLICMRPWCIVFVPFIIFALIAHVRVGIYVWIGIGNDICSHGKWCKPRTCYIYCHVPAQCMVPSEEYGKIINIWGSPAWRHVCNKIVEVLPGHTSTKPVAIIATKIHGVALDFNSRQTLALTYSQDHCFATGCLEIWLATKHWEFFCRYVFSFCASFMFNKAMVIIQIDRWLHRNIGYLCRV